MRVATWNLNHRAHPRVVPPWVISAMTAARTDVLVLTEYVPGKDVPRVAKYLSDHGAACVSVSDDQGSGDNCILIASTERHVPGPIPQPDIGLESAFANFLCVGLASGVIVVGFRMPEYSKTPASFALLWDWLFAALAPLHGRDLVLIGDLNTDFTRARDRQYRLLERFTEVGLSLVPVAGGVSYQGKNSAGSRLDHTFVGGRLRGVIASYDWSAINAAHPDCRGCNHGLPDHAMLVAEIGLR
jgi:hypothetical protein